MSSFHITIDIRRDNEPEWHFTTTIVDSLIPEHIVRRELENMAHRMVGEAVSRMFEGTPQNRDQIVIQQLPERGITTGGDL